MSALYHMVPRNMQGDILFPLNVLRNIHPKIYEQHVEKYKGRKHLLNITIPNLNCLWNDVLHFTAILPSNIKEALNEAGFNPPERKWFEIEPFLLDPNLTIVYRHDKEPITDKINQNHFEAYNPMHMLRYSGLPEFTKQYYRNEFENERRPLLFVGTPHILFKGNLNIKHVPVLIQ